jgi:metal-responsive CopG/Arc/MetJ family transcriptional regulator
MGRPPLNMRPIPVRISEEVVQRIDALVGTHQRAKFIREAIARELERREREGEEAK